MFRIDTTVYDAYGNNFTDSVIVEVKQYIQNTTLDNLNIPMDFLYWKSSTDKTDGYGEMLVIGVTPLQAGEVASERIITNGNKELTAQQYADMLDGTLTMPEITIDVLEGIFGVGNITPL